MASWMINASLVTYTSFLFVVGCGDVGVVGIRAGLAYRSIEPGSKRRGLFSPFRRRPKKLDGLVFPEDQVSLRQQALTILFKQFGNRDDIYECADEWVSKQVTTSGLVQYYKAYYNK